MLQPQRQKQELLSQFHELKAYDAQQGQYPVFGIFLHEVPHESNWDDYPEK
jgi:hypothetical protein